MRWCFAVLLLAACRTPPLDFDGGTTAPPPGSVDLAHGARDLAVAPRSDMWIPPPTSCCGQPGNPGNELGVGKYCQQHSDCAGQGDYCTFGAMAQFCSRACKPDQNDCGSGATCLCSFEGCGCIPDECIKPPPGC